MVKITQEEFLRKVQVIYPDGNLDFSNSVYTSSSVKVEVTCKKHGVFQQRGGDLLNGHGCKKCGREARSLKRLRFNSFDEFKNEACAKHANLFSYPIPVEGGFKNSTRVEILCPNHGLFPQSVKGHLLGHGCPSCRGSKISKTKVKSKEDFVQKATEAHGSKYSYDLVEYTGCNDKVEIICPLHGAFKQTPHDHKDGHGCPGCTWRRSDPQMEIGDFIKSLEFEYVPDHKPFLPNNRRELDIFIPEHNLAIEFNGTYWHSVGSGPKPDRNKHRDKFLACQERGIRLLQIDEHDWINPTRQLIWKSIIASRLGRHERRVFARKCTFSEISNTVANSFLEVNHLQGSTPSTRFCYGLFLEAELVGVITFSFHEKTQLNLTRLAFPVGTTVVGGANKLFRNALKALPKRDIITFSNNQYSSGDVYQTLGFTKDKDLSPSYQWLYKNQILNKRQCRHSRLPTLLGGLYDPNLTEHENMYRAGARCLYDAGYQRWAYRG